MGNDLNEKKELVAQSYDLLYDKKMAYAKVDLTEEEVQLLDKDEQFQARLMLLLVTERERVVKALKVLTGSADENVAFRSIMEYGKIMYNDQFRKADKKEPEDNKNPLPLPITINIVNAGTGTE